VTTASAADLAVPLAAYARRLHAAAGDDQHVASPLGAWLLLALCGPACAGEIRSELALVLGCEIETAAQTAEALLSQPHPLVAAAAAAWHRPHARTEALSGWQAGLPPAVETGELRDQAYLDDWARRHTLGMIRRFPIELTPQIELLLATALATRVSWAQPFDLAPAGELGSASPWAARLGRVLRTPARRSPGHRQCIAVTRAGDVAVHTAAARGGLLVTSVAAAPDVPAADVLAVAYDIAIAVATEGPVARRSLFDLPLGDGPLWTLTEQPAASARGREERCTAVLPAWSADSTIDLTGAGLGFDVAAVALARLLEIQRFFFAAKQACLARYSRTGFEAAAVTALAAGPLSMRSGPKGVIRVATLRFGHPFAVVAVAADDGQPGDDRSARPGPWHGMPVFSAWVTSPEEAVED
jgi:hypothetical protein